MVLLWCGAPTPPLHPSPPLPTTTTTIPTPTLPHPTTWFEQVALPFVSFVPMTARDGVDDGTGSARNRRERRLCSCLRHQQQSIAAVLATVTHHSLEKVGTASGVLLNQKTTTRTGKGEEHATHYTAKFPEDSSPDSCSQRVLPAFGRRGCSGELAATSC